MQREEATGIRDAMVEGFMREFGVDRETATDMVRVDLKWGGE